MEGYCPQSARLYQQRVVMSERHYTKIPNGCKLSSQADLQRHSFHIYLVNDRDVTQRCFASDGLHTDLQKWIQSVLICLNLYIQSCLSKVFKSISLLAWPCRHIIVFLMFSSGGGTSSCLCPEWKDLHYNHLPTIMRTEHIYYSSCYQWKNKKNSPAVMARHEAYFNLVNAWTLP